MRGLPWDIPPGAKPLDNLCKDLRIVKYEKRDGIAFITMNRPERLNAMGEQMHDELGQCWLNFKYDPSVRVAIITGTGRGFCAGHDLKEQDERHQAGDYDNDMGHAFMSEFWWGLDGPQQRWGLPDAYYRIEKPIIAAVNGIALGSGWGLIYASDIAIGSTEARIGDAEIRAGHLGEPLEFALHLPKKVAMGMALSGELLSAQRAYELGLLYQVVPPDQLMTTAEALAKKILALPWQIVKAYKEYITRGAWMQPEYASYFRTLLGRAHEYDEESWTEGPRAFVEKRKANYQPGSTFTEFQKSNGKGSKSPGSKRGGTK